MPLTGNSTDAEARLTDYLDDRLQTAIDVSPDHVTNLIESVRRNEEVLRQQLLSAQETERQRADEVRQQEDTLRSQIAAFESKQKDIEERCRFLLDDQSVTQVVGQWEPIMTRLGMLDVATAYVSLAKEVNDLAELSNPVAPSPRPADVLINSYTALAAISEALSDRQSAAEGAATHLVSGVEDLVSVRRDQLRKTFTAEVTGALDQLDWPGQKGGTGDDDKDSHDSAVSRLRLGLDRLLRLQLPDLNRWGRDRDKRRQRGRADSEKDRMQPPVLFAIAALIEPLKLRFHFHFMTDRPTNRIDAPELFLDAVLEMAATHERFVSDHIQKALWTRLSGIKAGNVGEMDCFVNATSAFIAGLIPMVRHKIDRLASDLLATLDNEPENGDVKKVITHLVGQVLRFDDAIRSTWAYTGGFFPPPPTTVGEDSPDERIEAESDLDRRLHGKNAPEWPGLAHEILAANDSRLFKAWLKIETDFALRRYDEIIGNAHAGEIDFDSVDRRCTKPTKAAFQVHDLLEEVTGLYRRLYDFRHRLRFLFEVQIAVLDCLFNRLNQSLESFFVLTSALGRRLQGTTAEERAELEGISGLDRLCRVYGSASYLEDTLKDWSDDVFFLDMYVTHKDWVERSRRRRAGQLRRHRPNVSIASTGSAGSFNSPRIDGEVRDVDVDGAGHGGADDDVGETESIFDESAESYRRLRDRAEKTIRDRLVDNVNRAIIAYANDRNANFDAPGSPLTPSRTSPSSSSFIHFPTDPTARSLHLFPALDLIHSHLTFLHRCLASGPMDRIGRAVGAAIDATLFSYVVKEKQFSRRGVEVFGADLWALAQALGGAAGADGRVDLSTAVSRVRKGDDGAKSGEDGTASSASSSQSSSSAASDSHKALTRRDTEMFNTDGDVEVDVSADLAHLGVHTLLNGKSGEGYRLLSVPSSPAPADDPAGTKDRGTDGDGKGGLTFADLKRELYAENDQAAAVLMRLRIKRLSIYEARVAVRNRADWDSVA